MMAEALKGIFLKPFFKHLPPDTLALSDSSWETQREDKTTDVRRDGRGKERAHTGDMKDNILITRR